MKFLDALWSLINKAWSKPKPEEESPGQMVLTCEYSILFRIDNDAPGVVLSYLIRHSDAPQDLLLNLISLAALKEDFARGREMRRRTDPFFLTRERAFDSQLDEYLLNSGWLNRFHISHAITLAWRSKKTYREGSRDGWVLYPIVAIPCDLQNLHYNPGDRYASWVVLEMAKVATRKTPGTYVKWRQIIMKYPWVQTAEELSRRSLGKGHILQPRNPGHTLPPHE